MRIVGLQTEQQYVRFFLGLDAGGVRLLDLVNNERMALKQRIGRGGADRGPLETAISVLESLAAEINDTGEEEVIARYG